MATCLAARTAGSRSLAMRRIMSIVLDASTVTLYPGLFAHLGQLFQGHILLDRLLDRSCQRTT